MADLVEQLDELAELKMEYYQRKKSFDYENEALIKRIQEIQIELRDQLIPLEQSLRTEKLIITYNRGRVVWNDEFLSEYAFSHPEILPAKKVGDPYITFRLTDYKHL